MTREPIIIIGMHRSGTSLLAGLLEAHGLHVGWRRDDHYEAPFFRELNEWMLRQAGAAWDRPEAFRALLADPQACRLVVDYLRSVLTAPRAISYLGPAAYARYRSPAAADRPWGWKDPRSTFTLPLWLAVFPRAKVIHICRHGVDVAHSLKARREAVQGRRRRYSFWWHLRHPRHPGSAAFVNSVRCASLDGGLSLWEEYMAEARAHVAALGARAIEVAYEDVVRTPAHTLSRLGEFCGLDASTFAGTTARTGIVAGRAFAHREDADLRAFATRAADRLKSYGY